MLPTDPLLHAFSVLHFHWPRYTADVIDGLPATANDVLYNCVACASRGKNVTRQVMVITKAYMRCSPTQQVPRHDDRLLIILLPKI